ncbi:ABC transporter ATP-binding protein [Aurantiacibacter sp. MUD11]|uniref:ABC transporter ATP-binding protein n=1 Tax=Aurantiacibacter sp. MUD11 TaxID=3003265 RepID=UPI0022AA4C9D|nr:ABC transporter ATP-binding protein [Aurantiacibacter sp. MUD11]WAT17992.1 ABC transporter ATP-binding protein [Aurantiacibacter sp. MUD11]
MTLEAKALTVAARLEDVSATLKPGEITAICGPNGAGKTTLLSAFAGLLAPDAGEVLLDGQPLSVIHPRERARAIGYLPQAGEVAWDVSVASLVALGRLPHGDTGRFAVASALAATDMSDFAHRPMSTLSGGEKARALLARVLAGEPRWILADEPLAALDLAHQLALLKVLRAEAQRGTGVVLVLHDLALAMNHADRVIVLDQGRTKADSAPEEALSLDIIRDVWGVEARWLGEPGASALVSAHASA